MKKFYSLSIFLALFFSVLLVGNLEAATYYIDGSNGSDSNPGTLTLSWKTLSKANSTLTAGDIVYIRAGTYREQICPKNSGSSGNYITYQRYPGDPKYSVIISTRSHGAYLLNKNYITIDGLYFNNCGSRWILIDDSDYNIIQNCKFYDSEAYTGILVDGGGSYNQFLDNIFEDAALLSSSGTWDAECQAAWDAQTALKYACNRDTAPADFVGVIDGWGNKIEGNTFGNCSHQAITGFTYYGGSGAGGKLIIRNNIVHNGYHTGISPTKGHYALIENNVIYNCGEDKALGPRQGGRTIINGPALYVMAEPSIIRKNKVYNNDYGLYFGATQTALTVSNNQRMYNNTFYNNTWQVIHTNDGYADKEYNNNIIKNNIFYNDGNISVHILHGSKANAIGAGFYDWVNSGDAGSNENYFINNMFSSGADNFYFKNTISSTKTLTQVKSTFPTEFDSSNFEGDPKFIDAANADFTLQSTSDAIDAGTWLTQVNDSEGGSGTSMVVDDSRYFYDGWGIPGETADYIWVDNPSSADFLVQISSIDYDTHTITLAGSKTWDDNAYVYLAYSSTVGIMGAGVDIGAYEYGASDMLSPPSGLVIKVSQN